MLLALQTENSSLYTLYTLSDAKKKKNIKASLIVLVLRHRSSLREGGTIVACYSLPIDTIHNTHMSIWKEALTKSLKILIFIYFYSFYLFFGNKVPPGKNNSKSLGANKVTTCNSNEGKFISIVNLTQGMRRKVIHSLTFIVIRSLLFSYSFIKHSAD